MQTTEFNQFGRYDLIAEIARGGMAVVYRAFDPRFEREVAIKVLPAAMMHDATFRTRFEREARTFAALDHPAIVPVYDFGEQNGQPYLVMRLMRGGSLEDRLKDGPMELEDVRRILGRLASALELAHQNGVIHRDLKPSNVLFDQYNDPFLSDFGISHLADATLKLTTNFTVGTPGYMSPEQIQGQELDLRSDIYSLGVLLFEMLTGQELFQADTPAMLVVKQMTEPIPDLKDIRPDLPHDTIQAAQRALAKSPRERQASAVEFARQIDAPLQIPKTIPPQAPQTEKKESPPVPNLVAPKQAQSSAAQAEDLYKTEKLDISPDAAREQGEGVADRDRYQTRKVAAEEGQVIGQTPVETADSAVLSPAGQREEDRSRRRSFIPWLVGIVILSAIGFIFWVTQQPPDPNSLAFDCLTDPGVGEDYPLIEAPRTGVNVRLDGRISTRREWAEAWCGDFSLHQGLDQMTPERLPARWWVQYNDNEINFLVRVPHNVDPRGVFINYFWPRYTGLWAHSDGVFMNVEWDISDITNWDEENWYSDEEMDPPGDFNVGGAIDEDDQYIWFEIKKELDSGDGYDWSLHPGIRIGWNPNDSLLFGVFIQNGPFMRHIRLQLLE